MGKIPYKVINEEKPKVKGIDKKPNKKGTVAENDGVKGPKEPKEKRKPEEEVESSVTSEPEVKPANITPPEDGVKASGTEAEPKQVTETFTIGTTAALYEFLLKKWHIAPTASGQFICRKMIGGVRHTAKIDPTLFDQIETVQQEVEKEIEKEKIIKEKTDKEFVEEVRKQKIQTSQPILAGEVTEMQWFMRLEPTLGRKVYHTLVKYVDLVGDELYDADAAVNKIMSYIDGLLDFEKNAAEFDKVKQENVLLLDFGKTIGQKYCDLRTEYLKDQALDRLMTRVLCQTCTRNVLEVRMQYGTVQSVPELMAIAEAQRPKEPVILNQGV